MSHDSSMFPRLHDPYYYDDSSYSYQEVVTLNVETPLTRLEARTP